MTHDLEHTVVGSVVAGVTAASHEDVAAINDWHKMAAEALAKWENKA